MKEIRKLAKEGDSRKGALTILAKDLVRRGGVGGWVDGWDGMYVCSAGSRAR